MIVMITEAQLIELVKQVKTATKQKKFKQSIELIINFKDIDVKKGFALNEVVQLPKTSSPSTVCVIATGDMSQKAKEAKADSVIGTEELDKFATNKRESRKFINKYDFFLADTKSYANCRKNFRSAFRSKRKNANTSSI